MAPKTPRVMENSRYEDVGTGPDIDTGSYDPSIGRTAPRFKHTRSARSSTGPAIQRRALQRVDGLGGVAQRQESGAWRTRTTVLGTLLLAGIAFMLAHFSYTATLPETAAPTVVEPEPLPESISGVEVRRGIGSKAE